MTRGVNDWVARSARAAKAVLAGLRRHARGDWGDLEEEDREANDGALASGERLLSAYSADDGTKFWVITEWDRSATTVLFPEEY